MSLIKITDYFKPTKALRFPYKAKVVSNTDPKKLGRVKATIKGLFEDSSTDKLPWIFPQNPYGLGGKTDSSSFSVPEVESELCVVFPFEDVYSPMYIGYWQSKGTHQSLFDDNYPDTYGFVDSIGNSLKVNKNTKDVSISHSSGNKIEIDQAGKETKIVKSDLSVTIDGKLEETVKGNIKISTDGNSEETVKGNKEFKVDGNAELVGKGGTKVGSSASVTMVNGSSIVFGGGGAPVARLGDAIVGTALVIPVVGTIITGSSKIASV